MLIKGYKDNMDIDLRPEKVNSVAGKGNLAVILRNLLLFNSFRLTLDFYSLIYYLFIITPFFL